MSSVFVASTAISSAPGFAWDVTGDEGALEIPVHLANEILAIPGTCFYTVDAPARALPDQGNELGDVNVEAKDENDDAEKGAEEVKVKPRATRAKKTKEETPSDEE